MIRYQSLQSQEGRAENDAMSVLGRKTAKVQKYAESVEKDFVRNMLLFHVQIADNDATSAL